jgi:hypothetical protein
VVFKKTKWFSRKPSNFLFRDFSNIFHVAKFSRTRYFEFLNYVLTINLEIL